MILRKIGENSYVIIPFYGDEDAYIERNGSNYVKVDDLPYCESGFYKQDTDGNFIVDDEKELEYHKQIKLNEISEWFNNLLENNKFMSSLGFEVDNRRSGTKNDKDNVQGLIDLGQEETLFKDANGNFHQLTLDQLKTLKQEMIQNGLQLYQLKFQKESEVNACTTKEELYSVQI